MFEFHEIRKAILCLLLVISLHSYSQCVNESDFFQYQDGIALPKEDDTHSEQIILSPEIPFITTKYESVYVGEIFSLLIELEFFLRSIQMVFFRSYYPLRIFSRK